MEQAGLAFALLLAFAAAALAWALRRRARQAPMLQEEVDAAAIARSPVAQQQVADEPKPFEPSAAPAVTEDPMVVAVAAEAAPGALEAAPIDDTDAVIRAARLYYEEGALLRAVQVLQLAVDRHPGRVRPWLALLELLRREGLVVDHAELAARFHDLHGDADEWRKVQYFGREIDPANALYRDTRTPPLQFDPVAETWLDMPASFDEALATELRHSLVRGAARAHPSDSASHAIG
jgi:hypothetical protein